MCVGGYVYVSMCVCEREEVCVWVWVGGYLYVYVSMCLWEREREYCESLKPNNFFRLYFNSHFSLSHRSGYRWWSIPIRTQSSKWLKTFFSSQFKKKFSLKSFTHLDDQDSFRNESVPIILKKVFGICKKKPSKMESTPQSLLLLFALQS